MDWIGRLGRLHHAVLDVRGGFMALADAVLDPPGLCPAAASLAALALERDPVPALRRDPDALMFLAQHGLLNSSTGPLHHEINDAFLLASLDVIDHGRAPF